MGIYIYKCWYRRVNFLTFCQLSWNRDLGLWSFTSLTSISYSATSKTLVYAEFGVKSLILLNSFRHLEFWESINGSWLVISKTTSKVLFKVWNKLFGFYQLLGFFRFGSIILDPPCWIRPIYHINFPESSVTNNLSEKVTILGVFTFFTIFFYPKTRFFLNFQPSFRAKILTFLKSPTESESDKKIFAQNY